MGNARTSMGKSSISIRRFSSKPCLETKGQQQKPVLPWWFKRTFWNLGSTAMIDCPLSKTADFSMVCRINRKKPSKNGGRVSKDQCLTNKKNMVSWWFVEKAVMKYLQLLLQLLPPLAYPWGLHLACRQPQHSSVARASVAKESSFAASSAHRFVKDGEESKGITW